MELEANGKKVKIEEPTVEQEEEYIKKSVDIFRNGTNYDAILALNAYKIDLLSRLTGLLVAEIKKLPSISVKKALKEVESRFSISTVEAEEIKN